MRFSFCCCWACVVHVVTVLASLLAIMCSSVWAWDVYPNPQTDLYRCGRRGRPSWVCDPHQILTYKEANELDQHLADLRNQTHCACESRSKCAKNNTQSTGYSVSVALMSFIPTSRTQDISIQSYANYLRMYEWRFGQCSDDIVIVYSQLENKVQASVGNVAAEMVTRRILEDIRLDTRHYLDNNEIYEGILVFVDKIREALDDTYRLTPGFPMWTLVHMCIGAIFVLVCFGSMWVCRKLYS